MHNGIICLCTCVARKQHRRRVVAAPPLFLHFAAPRRSSPSSPAPLLQLRAFINITIIKYTAELVKIAWVGSIFPLPWVGQAEAYRSIRVCITDEMKFSSMISSFLPPLSVLCVILVPSLPITFSALGMFNNIISVPQLCSHCFSFKSLLGNGVLFYTVPTSDLLRLYILIYPSLCVSVFLSSVQCFSTSDPLFIPRFRYPDLLAGLCFNARRIFSLFLSSDCNFSSLPVILSSLPFCVCVCVCAVVYYIYIYIHRRSCSHIRLVMTLILIPATLLVFSYD